MHPIVNVAIKAARKAGELIMRAQQRLDEIKIIEKGPNSFVTDIDQLAEQEIINTLRRAYPDFSVLGEEGGEQLGKDTDNLWIIDPIDGTTNFMHGLPHFAVSIALQVKGKIEHGVIYDPVRQELFTATRGTGAKLNDRRLRVAKQEQLSRALLGTGFPFRRNPDQLSKYMRSFEALTLNAAGIRRPGAATLDLAYVAAGRLDGFWEMGLNIWDMAAGVLLIKEAGGLVGDFSGGEDYFKTGNIVAANPKIFKAMLQNIV